MHCLTYALVTAAKNEEKYIQRTLDSVVSQGIPPLRWIIVDDGSNDGTGAIADVYAGQYSWITVVRRIAGPLRNFASKALAFAAGYERLAATAFDCIGNLDADVEFPRDYYERLLEIFERDASLGIARRAVPRLCSQRQELSFDEQSRQRSRAGADVPQKVL